MNPKWILWLLIVQFSRILSSNWLLRLVDNRHSLTTRWSSEREENNSSLSLVGFKDCRMTSVKLWYLYKITIHKETYNIFKTFISNRYATCDISDICTNQKLEFTTIYMHYISSALFSIFCSLYINVYTLYHFSRFLMTVFNNSQ